MTKTIKQTLIAGFLLLGVFTFLWNCQNEEASDIIEPESSETQGNGSVAKFISKEEAPKIIDYLQHKAGISSKSETSSSSSKFLETNFGIIQFEDIMQVVDTLGRDNYSFKLWTDDTNPDTFYNLIVGPLGENNERPSFILKYQMDADFSEELNNGLASMRDFRGQIEKYATNTFFSKAQNKSTCNDPCEVYDFEDDPEQVGGNDGGNSGGGSGGGSSGDGGSSGGGSGSNGSSGTSTTGGTGGGGPSVIFIPCGCEPHHDLGESCTCLEQPTIIIALQRVSKSSCNCEEGSGTVGVNLPVHLDNILNLNTAQTTFIENNPLIGFQINGFLANNDFSEEAIEFAEEAINALIDGGEVDFDEQIINELDGKALCVYNKLKSSSSGFKNSIKLFDGQFPVAHLKYENSSTLPSNINAQTFPPSNFLITIQINENNLERPNLSIARTIIHETIHAEMFRKILSILDNGGDLDGLTRTEWLSKLSSGDYPGIYDYYVRFGVNDMQHQQMAAHYRNIIENMLAELQPGLSQNIYEALAWVGLKDTETWNALTDAEKTTINSTINTFNASGAEDCN